MMDELMMYFHAHGVWDLLLLWINGALASGIFAILLFAYRGAASPHIALTWYERGARFLLVAAYGVLAVRVWLGWYYTPVEPTHVAVNALVLALVVMAHGDVAVIIRALRQMRATRESVLTEHKAT
ncbi:hypothetical protein FPJ27_37290 (plasmid) [Burkholderia sp. MS455]|uniref:phage holin family protein n=1 Tax=Burkholderia sp. MS455 TaxID=2811788 RepID=UPI0019561F8F|nr:phage holin family protein [Burkholderia sp. MS455]QRR07643.1 hypothetical protein FPJ27_15365 [Burkholderia sp. MS455]QRR11852.1 hypothetical protein FPJ27_37290 [Burkholderia sp. MS455]